MLHFPWIYFCLLSTCTVIVGSSKTIEIVRRGPNDERACDTRLMDTQTKLPDSAFSASSVRQNLAEFRPHHARLGSLYAGKDQSSGYAWCPNSTVQTAMNEWIQVDFPHLSIVRTIFTMGRGDGNVAEYMPYFVLHYQRVDAGPWYEHTTRDSERVIQVNIDPRNTARHTFDPAVIARRIRIYPYNVKSQHPVCLRFALKGCPFSDGITEYSATEGSRGQLGTDQYKNIDFRDLTNDAKKALKPRGAPGGLGKLVDNVAHFGSPLTQDERGSFNPYFVGWRRSRGSPVSLRFKFDGLRNFSHLLIFTFESRRLQVGLFNYTVIYFIKNRDLSHNEKTHLTVQLGLEGQESNEHNGTSWRDVGQVQGSSLPIVLRNSSWDGAVVVGLPLRGHIAQEVHLEIFHLNDWLLISEFQFISELHIPSLTRTGEHGLAIKANSDQALFGTVTTTIPRAIPVAASVMENVFHDDSASNENVAAGSMSSATVTHRHGLAKDHLQANSRGTTFIIVIVVSLLLSIFCLVVVFSLYIRMQHSRQRHRSLKKFVSIPSSQIPPAPLLPPLASQQDASAVALLASPYQPNAVGVSICNNLTSSGSCSVTPTAYLFSPAHSTSAAAAMYAAGAPPLHALSAPAVFSQLDACPDGLPSPGHNFASLAGGDLAAIQQLALQQQFYPSVGIIRPTTGDTATDSGSLCTSPSALCSILGGGGGHIVGRKRNEVLSAPIASPSISDDEAADIEAEEEDKRECEDMDEKENGRIQQRAMPSLSTVECNSMTISSASDEAQRASISAIGGGGGMNESVTASIEVEHVRGCENMALLRPRITSPNNCRKRPKHRRKRGVVSSPKREGRNERELCRSRVPGTVQENAFLPTHTMVQPFAVQPFPNICGSDILGTEYASTSLFGSSTASNNGISTLKKCSSPLIGTNGPVAQYPSPFLTTSAVHFPDQSGSLTSTSAGGLNTGSYHLYQPILLPAQQAHFFQAAAVGGFGNSQQVGGLVQSSPFLSQGLVQSTVPPTAAYTPEAPLASTCGGNGGGGGGACWPVQQTVATGLKSSSATPLPPLPTLPLPPSLHHSSRQNHNHSTNDSTSSGRLSIYSVCM